QAGIESRRYLGFPPFVSEQIESLSSGPHRAEDRQMTTTQMVLRRVATGAVVALAMLLASLSTGRAYWLHGVWVPSGGPPYGYYQPPPPPYYGTYARQPVWVAPHWDGYRWVPGHWRTY